MTHPSPEPDRTLSVPETVTMLLAGLEEDVAAMLAATRGGGG